MLLLKPDTTSTRSTPDPGPGKSQPSSPLRLCAALLVLQILVLAPGAALSEDTVARRWNEALLEVIRLDYPAPTVHSRNLFHLSAAMFDAWAAFDEQAVGYFVDEHATAMDVQAARQKAISHAAFGVVSTRFPTTEFASLAAVRAARMNFPALMADLGYDPEFTETSGDVDPAAELGNRIAQAIVAASAEDGAVSEIPGYGYLDPFWEPLNPPMVLDFPGVLPPDDEGEVPPELPYPNNWQPLSFEFLVLQNGIIVGQATQQFLGSSWGGVTPFALVRDDPQDVYDDPGPPPFLGCDPSPPCDSDTAFKESIKTVIRYSSYLDPDDGVMMDASPGARSNNTLGTNDGTGYPVNPSTGQPYAPNVMLRADYWRVLAEFWADGPSSETPPGHWNSIANYVTDQIGEERRMLGTGPVVDKLEWDVKLYFAINGAVHDAAIAGWDSKAKYDYVRPITMIRYMGGKGQSSDMDGPSYHEDGLPLEPGLIELVTEESSAPGQRHEFVLNNDELPAIGEIAIRVWAGQPEDPESQYSGVDWIRAVEWFPYQRETFVTPPFAAYVSGHSTFSRAAAEVLTRFTGDSYFPGGLATFTAPQSTFLEFEIGPTQEVVLQWARYYDAADEAGISRLSGGIHVPADDLSGRIMGSQIGIDAFELAQTHFVPEPGGTCGWLTALLALGWRARRVKRRGTPAAGPASSQLERSDSVPATALSPLAFSRPSYGDGT